MSAVPASPLAAPAPPAAAATAPAVPTPLMGEALAERFTDVRAFTETLVEPLSPEDCVVQPMPDASPAKWHLAHTTWFFEAFLLKPYLSKYPIFHPKFGFLFNSYYNALGPRHARAARGMLTRPSLEEVCDYRAHVDRHMAELLAQNESAETARLIEVGLHHEQQHQELLLTDIKYTLWRNPLRPAYRDGTSNDEQVEREAPASFDIPHSSFTQFSEGLYEVGRDTGAFCYDNEQPRHRVWRDAFELADRPVTSGEWAAFIEDGGYRRPELWLSAGWAAVQREGWEAPLYWERQKGGGWRTFTLSGMAPVEPAEPVCHVNYYEADAFARWAGLSEPGLRLPTEQEWEIAADASGYDPAAGDTADGGRLHPIAPAPGPGLRGLAGGVWEWTASPYIAYPGYAPPAGALGEYNGKFMCDQWVLRGGSCATSATHLRSTYRNFFPADARWQFSGLRLAR
ncbi:ergothioneine biosynthesis protein EgtB [Alienimonas californiensis]|uniref:Iron(II)-dependent oxidoreductase EgtB n=1 Tax=Alienimonas californiensis TaxID=2527989 RepID=A0A517PAS1_9PLAN|nr:ergothioneine biosynthesis protein EgtB [Alienimonas californiensis]QDT16475.1 Iron(II)-dependent oxidoreductase EgtB [Alienimonas californiensis]